MTLPGLAEETVTLLVYVNVVPGDQAAGRIPDPVVRTELVYQQTQGAKRRAADALRDGDERRASRVYADAAERLDEAIALSPSFELASEREILDELRARTEAGEGQWAAKASRAEQARKSRTRGRGI